MLSSHELVIPKQELNYMSCFVLGLNLYYVFVLRALQICENSSESAYSCVSQAKKADGGGSLTRVPYRTIDCFDHLTTSPFSECMNIDDLFNRAVELYGPTYCLGSRELLSEEDEVQPNGKVFRKVG